MLKKCYNTIMSKLHSQNKMDKIKKVLMAFKVSVFINILLGPILYLVFGSFCDGDGMWCGFQALALSIIVEIAMMFVSSSGIIICLCQLRKVKSIPKKNKGAIYSNKEPSKISVVLILALFLMFSLLFLILAFLPREGSAAGLLAILSPVFGLIFALPIAYFFRA